MIIIIFSSTKDQYSKHRLTRYNLQDMHMRRCKFPFLCGKSKVEGDC